MGNAISHNEACVTNKLHFDTNALNHSVIKEYSAFDNLLITLVICGLLPVCLVNWLIYHGEKYRDQFK